MPPLIVLFSPLNHLRDHLRNRRWGRGLRSGSLIPGRRAGSAFASRHVIAQHRHPLLNVLKNRLCRSIGQINTPMRSVGLVDRSPKAPSPGSVMHAYVSVKGHPIGYRCGISRSPQHSPFLLVGERISPGRSAVSPSLIS